MSSDSESRISSWNGGDDDEIQALRDKNRRLERALDDCTARLFMALQEDYPVSEASMRNDFTRIWEAIETWIDYLSGEEKAVFRQRYQDSRSHARLVDMGLDSERRRVLASSQHSDIRHLIILGLVVSQCLVKRVFQNPYPFGTSQSQEKVLSDIEGLIRLQDQKRERPRVNKWKSQTLSALITSGEFAERCKVEQEKILEHLVKELSRWTTLKTSSITRLRQEVVLPAVRLQQTIRCATRQYIVFEIDAKSGPVNQFSSTLKDMITWLTLREDTVLGLFGPLYPGLRRAGDGNVADLDLVKPVFLARKNPKSESQTSTRVSSLVREERPSSWSRDSRRSLNGEAGSTVISKASRAVGSFFTAPKTKSPKRQSHSSGHSPPGKDRHHSRTPHSRPQSYHSEFSQSASEDRSGVSIPRSRQRRIKTCPPSGSTAARSGQPPPFEYAKVPPYSHASVSDLAERVEYISPTGGT